MSLLACISLGFFSPTSAFAIITMDTMLKSVCQYLHRLQWQYVNICKQINMSVLSHLVLQCSCFWNTHALSNILRCFPIYQFKRLFVQIKQAQEAGAKNASSFFNYFQLPGSSECLKKISSPLFNVTQEVDPNNFQQFHTQKKKCSKCTTTRFLVSFESALFFIESVY